MTISLNNLALLVYNTPGRYGSTSRFIYYMPGALAGIANIMLWLFILNPGQSPLDPLWSALGRASLGMAHVYEGRGAEVLPFPADTFDLVTCLEALEFMPDPRLVLETPQGVTIRKAPVRNHTDAELIMLEAAVGRKPPFLDSLHDDEGFRDY
mgnify:CR=1 FL=1